MSEIYDALRRVQEECEAHAPSPANGGGHSTPSMLEEMLRQAEGILRFAEDVHRRMAEVGVDGIGGVFTLYETLRAAMDTFAPGELDASAAEVARLVETLQRFRDELQRMRVVKTALESNP